MNSKTDNKQGECGGEGGMKAKTRLSDPFVKEFGSKHNFKL